MGTSKNSKICVTLHSQNAHLLKVNWLTPSSLRLGKVRTSTTLLSLAASVPLLSMSQALLLEFLEVPFILIIIKILRNGL